MIRRSAVTLPHRVLLATDVSTTPSDGWRFRVDSTGESIVVRHGDRLESWDALAALHLSRSFAVVPDGLKRLGLPAESTLHVTSSVSTARGLWREICARTELPMDGSAVTLEVQPKGDHLAGELRVSTNIVLVNAGSAPDPLAPSIPGSRVWEDSIRVQLEGGRARLPMEVLSFRSTPAFRPFEKALFHVHVTGDPSTEVEQGLLVHLNSDHPTFVSGIEAKDPVATGILWDGIVREILRELMAQDLIEEEPARRGTLGELTRRWLQQSFPGLSATAIATMASERPAEFDACITSWCGTLQRVFATNDGQ
jgi:hypothetical protein